MQKDFVRISALLERNDGTISTFKLLAAEDREYFEPSFGYWRRASLPMMPAPKINTFLAMVRPSGCGLTQWLPRVRANSQWAL